MTNNKRKHQSQMSQKEKDLIHSIVKVGKYRVDSYPTNRMGQRCISDLDIALTVATGEVIEAHNNVKDDIRVLLRKDIKGKSCCVVVSIIKKRIVTCYWNDANDNHRTLNASLYKWNVNLIPILLKAEREGGRLS